VKRLAVVAACVLAGLAAGAIWTWLQSDRYRADARVLVRPPTARVVPAVEALAESSLIASNVAQTLHLSSPPDVSAKTGKGGVLTVSVEAADRERARQVDAEVVTVLMQNVAQRFGAAGVTTTSLDPAHVSEQTSPRPWRNVVVAVLVAAAVAVGALALMRSPVAHAGPADAADGERRLQRRIDSVAKRERALAKRAGELAARERELEQRRADLLREAEPQPERVAPAAPDPEPEPEAPPSAETVEAPDAHAHKPDGWTIDAVEDLMRRRTGRDPSLRDELAAYVVHLRKYADTAGRLPSTFDSLIEEVFVD
jgi:capsular polysaccharide biosynthesis protein